MATLSESWGPEDNGIISAKTEKNLPIQFVKDVGNRL